MIVGDSEEENWRAAAEEEEGGAEACRAYWEPRSENLGVGQRSKYLHRHGEHPQEFQLANRMA